LVHDYSTKKQQNNIKNASTREQSPLWLFKHRLQAEYFTVLKKYKACSNDYDDENKTDDIHDDSKNDDDNYYEQISKLQEQWKQFFNEIDNLWMPEHADADNWSEQKNIRASWKKNLQIFWQSADTASILTDYKKQNTQIL